MPTVDADTSIESPLDIPKDKTPPPTSGRFGGGGGAEHIAANSGVLDVRVWINRRKNVPFSKTNWFNDSIIFNSATIRDYPRDLRVQLASTPNTEGVYLKPLLQYRHVFIAGQSAKGLEELKTGSAFIAGEPVYKKEQRFLIVPSFFQKEVITPDNYTIGAKTSDITDANVTLAGATTTQTLAEECKPKAMWAYEAINKESQIPDDTAEKSILMPKQTSSSTCSASGVHWGLEKETDLFQGEDFFIEFHRRASSTDIPNTKPGSNDDLDKLRFSHEYASILDVQGGAVLSAFASAVGVAGAAAASAAAASLQSAISTNRGVVDVDHNNNVIDRKQYDFRDQAYYVIEIGKGHSQHNYFILITQRGPVRLIRKIGGDKKRTEVVAEFTDTERVSENNQSESGGTVNGAALISAASFGMVVRNHLGKLVIQFYGPGISAKPWIIERKESKAISSRGDTETTPVTMFVPAAKLAIYGGNLQTAFLFGPLQYLQPREKNGQGSAVTFKSPPQRDPYSNTCKTDAKGLLEENSYALPTGGKMNVLLTAVDHPIQDLLKTGYTPRPTRLNRQGRPAGGSGGSNQDKNITDQVFTQDAQAYRQIVNGVKSELQDGSFFKKSPIKAITPGRRSSIEVGIACQANDSSNRSTQFVIEIKMKAGGHVFESGWELPSCKTPILTLMRLASKPAEDKGRWEAREFECGEHVMSFSDSWTAQDFTKIEHTGNIKFLLNNGVPFYEEDRTGDILDLRNKAFYIEVWAGYKSGSDGGIFASNSACNYSKLPHLYKMFTGICYGGTVTYEYGKRVMDCQIFDYSKVLQDMLFFNSPFFDGVKDVFAVDEILRFAGFRGSESNHPRFLTNLTTKNPNQDFYVLVAPDGRAYISRAYALPSSYQRLQQPFFKFKDGDKFYDGIIKMAERAGKLFFFDAHGVAHYENYHDLVADEMTSGQTSGESGCQSVVLAPLWWFTTGHGLWQGQQVFNQVSIMEDVQSVYNHRKLLTNTPDFTPIWGDDVDYDSIEDPQTEGFLGYMRTLFQQEGAFGSFESAQAIMFFYKAMGRPPYVVKFETYGLPARALDIISLNGQRLRVMRVESNIDPSKNVWWQTYECEWLKPIQSDFSDFIGSTKQPNNPASGNC